MKKQLMIALISLVPALSYAKVSDFNAMISDNMKAQTQLHKTVQESTDTARIAAREKSDRGVLVEASGASYNVATKKDLLTFEKEKRGSEVSQKEQMDRLAAEVSNSEF